MNFEIFDFTTKNVLESVDINIGCIEGEKMNDILLSMHLSRMKADHLSQRKAKTRNQSEVHGTTAKEYKQKGTGNARHGSKKSCQQRHGGTMFGPRGTYRHISLPKGEVRKVKRMLLSTAINDKKFFVVSNFNVSEGKTSMLLMNLGHFLNPQLKRVKCLMICEGIPGRESVLSSRNLRGVKLASVKDFTVHNLVDADFVLITKEAAINLAECVK